MTDTANMSIEDILEGPLKELLGQLQENARPHKSFLEIAGRESKEVVNSNILAYYLDPNEDHGMGTAFLWGLFEAYNEKINEQRSSECPPKELVPEELIPGYEITVEREKDRVDILISGTKISGEDSGNNEEGEKKVDDTGVSAEPIPDWEVIVENKLYAGLGRNKKKGQLQRYWEERGKRSNDQYGILLSLYKVGENEIEENAGAKDRYFNVLHQELTNKVKKNLSSGFERDAQDRHLLFIKDFFHNIETLSRSEMAKETFKNELLAFYDHGEQIRKIHEKEDELLESINDDFKRILNDFGFDRKSESTKKAEHYNPKEDASIEKVPIKKDIYQVFFWLTSLRYDPTVWGVLQLINGENTQYGTAVKKKLEELEVFDSQGRTGIDGVTRKDSGGKDGGTYQHIYLIDFSLKREDIKENGFEETLRDELRKRFFSRNFLEKAQEAYDLVSGQ